MARKIMLQREGGSRPSILTEILADDEARLQQLMKENPELLPIEEFGMTGPPMVVGRETTLPSGAVDLIGISRGGDLLLIEFKTGPQNSDFRHVLAQLLDYGSDLWQMSYEEFESTVAKRY
jgi:RecB family endonuclease NucS